MTTRSMPSSRASRAPLTSCTVICVEPWISKPGIHALDEPDEPEVLRDDRAHATIDGVAEQQQRVLELRRLEQDVEREVDADATRPRHRARLVELVERELGALVARVEAFDAHVDGIRAVGDGGANGVEGTGGSEEFGNLQRMKVLSADCSTLVLELRRRAGAGASAGLKATRASAVGFFGVARAGKAQ